MKTTTLSILLAATITGCSSITSLQSYKQTTVLNFTPFTKQGFLFTPEPYPGDYESVGMITVSISASGERKRMRPGIYDWDWDLTQIQADSVLSYFYNQATVLGADAVVRLSLSRTTTDFGELSVPTIVATGFAIKRMHR
jgi:hypothetical protein